MTTKISKTQPDVLEGAPIRYAPKNELGVVFLFAHLAKRWRIRVEEISAAFPDCIAYKKIHGKEKRIRIEFEYKSGNFKRHKHNPDKCDMIVCWEHNWPEAPKHLEIRELRKEFGLGFNVWIMPVKEEFKESLKRYNSFDGWSVPRQAHEDDIILFYFTRPEMSINHVFVLKKQVSKIKAGYRKGKDFMAPVSRVCQLKAPIFLEDLKSHKILKTAHFVRSNMQGRHLCGTEYWPYLYDMIISRNPSIKKKLQKYAPENL